MIGRRNFFRALAGAGASIAALWSGADLASGGAITSFEPYLVSSQARSDFEFLHIVKAREVSFGPHKVKYREGMVCIPGPGKWYIYADDPDYLGGYVEYRATQDSFLLLTQEGRILFETFSTFSI